MNNKKTISIILVVLLISLVFILAIVERINYQKSLSGKIKYDLVKDASEFFTVDDCANRYITYLSSGDTKNLLAIMNEDYVNENGLNSNNIINRLDTANFNSHEVSFRTKKMLVRYLSNAISEYYLYGEIYVDSIDDYYKMMNYYLVITVDSDTLEFNVKPYDGAVFKENKNE